MEDASILVSPVRLPPTVHDVTLRAKSYATKISHPVLIDVNVPATRLRIAEAVQPNVNYDAVTQLVRENAASSAFLAPSPVTGIAITWESAECRAVRLATDFHAIFVVNGSSSVGIDVPRFVGRYALQVAFVRFVVPVRWMLSIISNTLRTAESIWIRTRSLFFLVNISSLKAFWTVCWRLKRPIGATEKDK